MKRKSLMPTSLKDIEGNLLSNYKIRDFLFLYDDKAKKNFGLSQRVYNVLTSMANGKELNTKEDILNLLKGKTKYELLKHRNFGYGSLKELRRWVFKNRKV